MVRTGDGHDAAVDRRRQDVRDRAADTASFPPTGVVTVGNASAGRSIRPGRVVHVAEPRRAHTAAARSGLTRSRRRRRPDRGAGRTPRRRGRGEHRRHGLASRPGRRLEAGVAPAPGEPRAGRPADHLGDRVHRAAQRRHLSRHRRLRGPDQHRRRRRLDPRRSRAPQLGVLALRRFGAPCGVCGHVRRALGARAPEPPGAARLPGRGARLALARDRCDDPGGVRGGAARHDPVWCRAASPPEAGRAATTASASVAVWPIASPPNPARTCCSTPRTRSTGIRGETPPSSARAATTARCCCRSATARATGATSWPTSPSRTRRSRR